MPAERHQNGAAIHSDAGFLCDHRFAKFNRQCIDSGLQKIALIEVQRGIQKVSELIRGEILGNFSSEFNDKF